MSNALIKFWVSLAALGGLLGITSINLYSIGYILIPILTSTVAFFAYKKFYQRKLFFFLAIMNLGAGIILRLSPHAANGGLSSFGVLISLAVFIPSVMILFKMFRKNYAEEINASL